MERPPGGLPEVVSIEERKRLPRKIRDDFLSGTRPFRGAAFHEPLKTIRAVFAGEVAIALAHAFIPSEGGVLAYFPAGVTSEQIGCFPWCR